MWSSTECATARGLAGDGYTAPEIAKEMEKTLDSVKQWLSRNRVSTRDGLRVNINPYLRAAVLEMVGKGLKVSRMAEMLGRHPATISQVLRRLEEVGLVRARGATRSRRFVLTKRWRDPYLDEDVPPKRPTRKTT